MPVLIARFFSSVCKLVSVYIFYASRQYWNYFMWLIINVTDFVCKYIMWKWRLNHVGPLVNNETTFTYFRWIRNVRLIDIVNVKIVFSLLIQILYKFQAICVWVFIIVQGPVVQSIVSLTSSLRGQLVKFFTTLITNILIFLLKKMWEAFAMQKLLTFFQ